MFPLVCLQEVDSVQINRLWSCFTARLGRCDFKRIGNTILQCLRRMRVRVAHMRTCLRCFFAYLVRISLYSFGLFRYRTNGLFGIRPILRKKEHKTPLTNAKPPAGANYFEP